MALRTISSVNDLKSSGMAKRNRFVDVCVPICMEFIILVCRGLGMLDAPRVSSLFRVFVKLHPDKNNMWLVHNIDTVTGT